jgi:hypothetical protein
MANLYDILASAQQGDALTELSDQFGLTPQQTQAAVAALLPAISLGLKRATETPEGLADLLATMGTKGELFAMYDDPRAAFSRQGRDAGNAVLAKMFGTPDASRAIADQAQQFSGGGVTSSILKKLLPVLVGMIISGLMRSGSGKASPAPAPQPVPQQDGGNILGDILREIFGQGSAGSGGGRAPSGPVNSPVPPIGDILGSPRDGSEPVKPAPVPTPRTPQPVPFPTDTAPTDPGGQPVPGGDILGQILRELEKGIKEGRIKPVIVGPYEIDIPDSGRPSGQAPSGQAPSGDAQQQAPGSDIFGQILRDLLTGALGGGQKPAGQAVFGELIEPGKTVDPSQVKTFQDVLDQFMGAPRR